MLGIDGKNNDNRPYNETNSKVNFLKRNATRKITN